jgi:hypothetical protein
MFLTQSRKEKFSVFLCSVLSHNISAFASAPLREKISRKKNDKPFFSVYCFDLLQYRCFCDKVL